MDNLKVRECILSGYVLSISKSKPNVSKVRLKTKVVKNGVTYQNAGIPIIVSGNIDHLQVNDPIAFRGIFIPDKFNQDSVCMIAYAENMFIPMER